MQENFTKADINTTRALLNSAVVMGNMNKSSVDEIVQVLEKGAGVVEELEPRLLSIKSVMARLQMSRQSIYNLVARNALERVKIGKSTRIRESSVLKLMKNGFE